MRSHDGWSLRDNMVHCGKCIMPGRRKEKRCNQRMQCSCKLDCMEFCGGGGAECGAGQFRSDLASRVLVNAHFFPAFAVNRTGLLFVLRGFL